MNRTHTILLLASLAVVGALTGGAANATDHRMWRDQVARPVDTVIELESKPADPNKRIGNDSLLWREQIQVASTNRVFVFEPAPQRFTKTRDTRLWREQIKSSSAGNKKRIVSNSGRTDKISSQ